MVYPFLSLTINFKFSDSVMNTTYHKPITCMKNIKRNLSMALCAMLLFLGLNASAVTKRALFMAIDIYNPEGVENKSERNWSNLEGCVNDAEEVKALVAAK